MNSIEFNNFNVENIQNNKIDSVQNLCHLELDTVSKIDKTQQDCFNEIDAVHKNLCCDSTQDTKICEIQASESLINLFESISEPILSDDQKNNKKLIKNLKYAREAILYTKKELSYGGYNTLIDGINKENNVNSKFIAESRICVMREIMKNYKLDRLVTESEISNIIANLALLFEVGNCIEETCLAEHYLHEVKNLINIEPVKFIHLDHAFLVIGRKYGSDINNYKSWGDESVVCDPWSGQFYPACNLEIEMNRGFEKMHDTQRLDLNKHIIWYKYFAYANHSPDPFCLRNVIHQLKLSNQKDKLKLAKDIYGKKYNDIVFDWDDLTNRFAKKYIMEYIDIKSRKKKAPIDFDENLTLESRNNQYLKEEKRKELLIKILDVFSKITKSDKILTHIERIKSTIGMENYKLQNNFTKMDKSEKILKPQPDVMLVLDSYSIIGSIISYYERESNNID